MLRPADIPDLAAWAARILDPATTLRIDNAIHDQQPPEWRLDGLRLEGHLNWFIQTTGVTGIVAGMPVDIEPGGWLCLAPGTPLHFRPLRPRRPIRLLRFRTHLSHGQKQLVIPGGGFLVRRAESLQGLFSEVVSNAHRNGSPWEAVAQRARVGGIYAAACALLAGDGSGRLSVRDIGRIEARTAAMDGALTPQVLAALVGWKPEPFAHAFRHHFGCSPRRWLADRRIHRAAELLLTTRDTAGAIAAACGFADPYHFSRRFAAVIGCGTRVWRRRHGIDPTAAGPGGG